MGINYEIYGSPETWHYCYYGGGSTQPWAALVHGEKAKVPTWGLTTPDETPTFVNSQLRTGVTDNKLTPTQPIDNSICAVGQGRLSPFRKFAVYANRETTQATNGEIIQIGHAYTGANFNDNETPVNTFWYEANCSSSYGLYANGAFSSGRLVIRDGATITQGLDQRIWSPTGVNEHATKKQNGNFYIAPFMSYGARTYVLQIWVYVTSADYDAEYEGNVPNGNWRTLDDWKNNYPTKAITGCLLRVRSISSYDASTGVIGYYGLNYGSSDYRKVACGILDTIKFELDDGTTLPELTSYGLFSNGSNTDIGVSLFNGLTNIYKWSDTLQQIAVIPEYISNFIKTYGTSLFPYIPYSDDIYDWIMESCACFGMAFTPAKGRGTDSSNCRFNQNFTDPDLCLPIIDNNGIAHGDYTRGSDNINNDFINLSSQWDKNYTPSTPVDPNTYSDTTNWNNVDFRQAFTKRYLLTGAQVAGLATELWAAQSSKPADIDYNNFAIDEYLTNNPIDTIVSLKYFPCTFSDTAPAIVHLGKYTTNIAATALGTSVRIIDFAPIECFPHFNDFRDYEPYTELAMYIPFCGTVKIPTAECMGNYVSVKLAIDTNTGAATGYIIVSKTGSGGICVATCQGMAAIDIPVSGLQSANLANAVFNATANWTQTQINNISANSGLFKNTGGVMGAIARGMTDSVKLSDVKGGILGGPIGAVGSLVNRLNPISALQSGLNIDLDNAKADYELSHIQVPTRLVGSASPALGCVIELDCRLIIYRPVTDENALSNYADTVGFATVQGGTVSGFSGFTVGTIDVSGINATAKEKQAIAAAFANGVYL